MFPAPIIYKDNNNLYIFYSRNSLSSLNPEREKICYDILKKENASSIIICQEDDNTTGYGFSIPLDDVASYLNRLFSRGFFDMINKDIFRKLCISEYNDLPHKTIKCIFVEKIE